MSACLTMRSDWVLHCLSKLPSREPVQVNALPASFSPVYWYWEVNLKTSQWTHCCFIALVIITCDVPHSSDPYICSQRKTHMNTVATCKLYREKEPVSFDWNQTQKVCFCCKSTVLMCSNFKEAANNHCYGKSMSTFKCSNAIYGIWLGTEQHMLIKT